MNNNQTLKAGMFKRMGLFFTKYQTTLQPFTKLWNIITQLNIKSDQLTSLIQQQATDSTGETKNKTLLKDAMINSLIPVARKARVWANEEANTVLETLFDINQRTFLYGDEECLGIARNILQGLNNNAAALLTYNITAAQLTAIDAACTTFEAAIGKPGLIRNVAKTGTQGIDSTLREMTDLINKCDDLIDAEFGSTHTEMVAEYFANRKIGTATSRHTTLTVTVYSDAAKTQPVADALLTIAENKLTAITDSAGMASIDTFAPGNLTAVITATGYVDATIPFAVKMGRQAELEVVLEKG